MTRVLDQLPQLLHDARLRECCWDVHLRRLSLDFICLRRNLDGSPIADPSVELRLVGVESIVAHYSPANLEVRPSDFVAKGRLCIVDLESWSRPPTEIHLSLNSEHSEFELATACVKEHLFGQSLNGGRRSEFRVHLSFDQHDHGRDATASSLAICCDSIESFTNGAPLDLDLWQSQFKAWWQGWQQHWSVSESETDPTSESALEDAFIPAGDSSPDLSYQPPQESAFELAETDAPAELIKPIEDFHVGLHERDWLRVASAYPHFDRKWASVPSTSNSAS
jgi:hypothetical protein